MTGDSGDPYGIPVLIVKGLEMYLSNPRVASQLLVKLSIQFTTLMSILRFCRLCSSHLCDVKLKAPETSSRKG